jgi:hypothetical protein
MKKLLTTLSMLVVAFATISAQAVPLSDLFAGQTMTVDDKLFSNWELFQVTDPEFSAPIDLSLIDVTGLDDDPLNPGLHFEANGQLTVSGLDFLDLNFGFDVTVMDPGFRIKDNSLEITEFAMGDLNLGGLILIEETIFDAAGNEIGFKEAFVDNLLLDEQLFDSAEFVESMTISVEKNILIAGDDFDDVVELISFEQRFSQKAVPEPSTWLLMGVGLAAIGVVRRRKRG